MFKLLPGYALVALLAAAFAWPVAAELATPLTIDEKAATADVIVHARCTGTATEWRNGKVFTVAHFEVLDDMRASGLAQIEIVNPGGTAVHPVLGAAVATRVSDTVPVATGDEVLLFARRHDQDELRILAGSQGYLKIDRDGSGTARVRTVERRVTATPARAGQPDGARVEQTAYTLDQYKQRIRAKLGTDK